MLYFQWWDVKLSTFIQVLYLSTFWRKILYFLVNVFITYVTSYSADYMLDQSGVAHFQINLFRLKNTDFNSHKNAEYWMFQHAKRYKIHNTTE